MCRCVIPYKILRHLFIEKAKDVTRLFELKKKCGFCSTNQFAKLEITFFFFFGGLYLSQLVNLLLLNKRFEI